MKHRRPWAILAFACALAAVALAIATSANHFPSGLTVLACLVVAIGASWIGVTRRGLKQTLGFSVAAVLVAVAIVLMFVEHRILEDALVIAAALAMLAATRQAFRVHVKLPRAQPLTHPVLFYNPKSGGGKATRFHLAREARRRDIEPIELALGDDLETLVREAVGRGADGLAMAGGDGSQAIVAKVAAERGLPYACIPAGTRNHFALDLGVDRNDVVGALDAFVNGGERIVDLAEVNGQIFVNNVSLGLYADAVQRPGYREAKMHTLLETVPTVLGPDAQPSQLRWSGPSGLQSAAAILISNNAYRLGHAIGSGTRPRLDQGLLGIMVLAPVARDGEAPGKRTLTMEQWTAAEFEITAEGATPAGIDGEAVMLEPPLQFRIKPAALRVRIAPTHPGASPSAIQPEGPWQTVVALARLALRGEQATPHSAA